MRTNNFLKLVIAIAVSEFAGIIGSAFTISAITGWYADLIKPTFNPPAWAFGPVWTALYALIGISFFLVWSFDFAQDKKQHSNTLQNMRMLWRWRIGVVAFFVQLSLNAFWSIIFFGLQSPGWALVDIIALLFAIVWTMIVFYKISPPSSSWWTTAGHGKLAAYLLVPYILWVSFASYLNYSIWMLN